MSVVKERKHYMTTCKFCGTEEDPSHRFADGVCAGCQERAYITEFKQRKSLFDKFRSIAGLLGIGLVIQLMLGLPYLIPILAIAFILSFVVGNVASWFSLTCPKCERSLWVWHSPIQLLPACCPHCGARLDFHKRS